MSLFGPVTRSVAQQKASVSSDPLVRAWSDGDLRCLLRDYQAPMHAHYREWEKLVPEEQPGQFARMYLMDVARRLGKTSLRFIIRSEDAIRNPGHVYRSVTAFQKDIEEIVDDVARVLLDSCPLELRPVFKLSSKAQSAGFYWPNGSIIKLAGLDKNPNALRGRASDGDDASEAVYIRNLESSIKNVLYAQYQGRPWARMCLESSAPEGPETSYDTSFVADAKLRGAYIFRTIDDNTSLSDAEREEFIRAAGGRENHECKREYFNIRTRDPERVLVPEFDELKHVRRVPVPNWFTGYTVMDPGMTDLLGLVMGYWHEELRKLIVMRSWAEYNAGTHEVADAIREIEHSLWSDRNGWYDDKTKRVQPQPLKRISDTDKRIVYDMARDHKIAFSLAAKTDIVIDGRNHSTLQVLRTWVKNDQVLFDPDCGPVLDHIRHGKWNDRRTDWYRHPLYGHFDCLAALKYLPRHIEQNRLATPPARLPKLGDTTADFERPVTVPPHLRNLAKNWGNPR